MPILQATAQELYREAVPAQAEDAIESLLPTSAITAQVQADFTADADLDKAQTWITDAVGRDPALW